MLFKCAQLDASSQPGDADQDVSASHADPGTTVSSFPARKFAVLCPSLRTPPSASVHSSFFADFRMANLPRCLAASKPHEKKYTGALLSLLVVGFSGAVLFVVLAQQRLAAQTCLLTGCVFVSGGGEGGGGLLANTLSTGALCFQGRAKTKGQLGHLCHSTQTYQLSGEYLGTCTLSRK